MTTADFLADLRSRGVTVRYDLDSRCFRISPPGVLTDADRALIVAHRADLRELLFAEIQLPDWKTDLYDWKEPQISLFRKVKGKR